MGASRYWRLEMTAHWGGTTLFVGEVEFRAAVGGPNVAVGGTASAINQFNTSTTPAMAFDGVLPNSTGGGGWMPSTFATPHPTGQGAWLQYDFGGSPMDIVEVAIKNGAYTTYTNTLRGFNFLSSDDGVKWKLERKVFDLGIISAPNSTRVYSVVPLSPAAVNNRIFDNPLVARRPKPAPVVRMTTAQDLDVLRRDPVFAGQYRLAGTTTSLNFPVGRRVRLYHQLSGKLARQLSTKADGKFEFRGIEEGPWTVVGVDDTGVQNGVIYTHVLAVKM